MSIGRIVRAGFCDDVHAPAAPGDSGTAIGAAAWHTATDRLPTGIDQRCYLGPHLPIQSGTVVSPCGDRLVDDDGVLAYADLVAFVAVVAHAQRLGARLVECL